MRIIAGSFGGQPLQAPRGHRTHPMSEKMRGAIFAMLGDISDLNVLDAFAGSGAVGLEALSREAAQVTFVENNQSAIATIKANIKHFAVKSRAELVTMNIKTWASRPAGMFDIIIVDPPYDDLQEPAVRSLAAFLADEGVFVLSWPGGSPAPELTEFMRVAQKNYGDSQLIMYKKNHA